MPTFCVLLWQVVAKTGQVIVENVNIKVNTSANLCMHLHDLMQWSDTHRQHLADAPLSLLLPHMTADMRPVCSDLAQLFVV